MTSYHWPKPQSRMVGLFTDLQLFPDALRYASDKPIGITRFDLEEELSHRTQGLLLIDRQSPRRWSDLIREMRYFGWLKVIDSTYKPIDDAKCKITPEGEAVLQIWQSDKEKFFRILAKKMQDRYVIPGWFVSRLWNLNPEREGEVVIPVPLTDWSPPQRPWANRIWDIEIENQSRKVFESVTTSCPGGLPITENKWVDSVKESWTRLGNIRERTTSRKTNMVRSEKRKLYSPRQRLAQAMSEASISILFADISPNAEEPDFFRRKQPLSHRLFTAWCPRLEALGLIFYTDAHPLISGRLLFPVSVFRKNALDTDFVVIGEIYDPQGRNLWLHQPRWELVREQFLETLFQEHRRASTRVGSLYAPLLDVRDEVCRQLRLSATCFDSFIGVALREAILPGASFSISVETDVREDQRMAYRLLRRPVWINGISHSLIAMTEYRKG